MRFNVVSTLLAAGLVVAACGQDSDKKDKAVQEPTEELTAKEQAEADAAFALIPKAAIVRVKVDEQGNPIGEPEMKVSQEIADELSDAEMASLFDSAAAPQAVVTSADELDQDSSTQSWLGWDNYGAAGYNNYGAAGYNNYGAPGYNYGATSAGGSYGYNQGPGYSNGYNNSYASGPGYSQYNSSYWQQNYNPYMSWQGSNWNYSYSNSYNYGGYNYHCYRPVRKRCILRLFCW